MTWRLIPAPLLKVGISAATRPALETTTYTLVTTHWCPKGDMFHTDSAQQLNKSFICNVPSPYVSSFRCKRSNNFLNKESKKRNIYKIPIQLIINGLSKAPLCIRTTAVFCWKRTHCNYISNLSFLKNKTEKKKNIFVIIIIIIIIYLQNAPEISFHLK